MAENEGKVDDFQQEHARMQHAETVAKLLRFVQQKLAKDPEETFQLLCDTIQDTINTITYRFGINEPDITHFWSGTGSRLDSWNFADFKVQELCEEAMPCLKRACRIFNEKLQKPGDRNPVRSLMVDLNDTYQDLVSLL